MRNVSSFQQSFDEPANLVSSALVQLKRGHRIDKALVEPGDLRRSDSFECAEAYVACDYWCEAPVVGATQRTNASYLELGGIEPDFFFSCEGSQTSLIRVFE